MSSRTTGSSGTTRRTLMQLLVASGAGGAVAAACGPVGGPQPGTAPTAEPVTLEYVGFLDPDQLPRITELWGRFTQQHSNVRVEHVVVPGAQVQKREKMQTLVAGGTPPALLSAVSTEYPSYYVLTGLIEALDDLMAADKVDRKAFSATAIDALQYRGKQYLMPYGASMELLAYNKDLFQKSGVKPPPKTWDDPTWTLDQFIQTGKALTKIPSGGEPEQFGVGRGGYFWIGWPLLWGSEWVTQDLSRFTGTSAPTTEAMQARQDFFWKHHVAAQPSETGIFGGKGYLSGKQAMTDTGTWNLLPWIKQAGFDWDVAPWFRAGGASASTLMYPVGLAIGKGYKHRRQAWDFIKYVTQQAESNLEFAYVHGAVPALLANQTPWRTLVSKEKPGLTAQVATDVMQKYGKVGRIRLASRFDEIDQQYVGPAVKKIETNEMPAQAALEQIAPQVQQLLSA